MSQLNSLRGKLHYQVSGSGPCVILCHALGTDSGLWSAAVRKLSRFHTVVTYDLRGHGQSHPPADNHYSFEAMADDTREVLDHLQVETADVVGISVGGEVAQMFAVQYPKRVRSLFLCSTACVTESERAALWQQRINKVTAHGMSAIAQASVERWFTAAFRQRHPLLIEEFTRRLVNFDAAVYVAMARTIQAMDLRPAIGTIQCRTRILYADQDANTGRAAADSLVANIPGADAVEIANSAHFPNLEAAARFNRILQQWLFQNQA